MSERYRLVRLLGGGGMAEVYLAVARGAEGFEKPVAIKRVLPHLAQNESIARMFLAEAKLSMHLHHQNIAEVMDVGRGPDGLFMVMELVNGWDLSIVFGQCAKKNVRIPPHVAVFIAAQAAAGLCHAYRRTLDGKPLIAAHRDISPSNIMVSDEGEVKVADFGIARIEQSQHTEPGTFKGKIPYAAPEVVRGQPATPASDQFALGVVLHKMLVGKHPFGHFDNLVLYSETLAQAQPPQLAFVPAPLATTVRRMLAIDAAERFPSFDEAAQALNTFLGSTGTPSSAAEVARFIQALEMPPTPMQLLAEGPRLPQALSLSSEKEFSIATGTGTGTGAQTRAASSLALADASLYLNDNPSEDWMGAGPALDPTGELAGEPVSARPASPSFFDEPGSRPGAGISAETAARALAVQGPGAGEPLTASHLQTPAEAASELQARAQPPRSGSGLELSDNASAWLARPEAREAPPPESFTPARAPARRSRSRTPALLILAVLGAGALLVLGAGVVAIRMKLVRMPDVPVLRGVLSAPTVETLTGQHEPRVLTIDSTPAGATVQLDGQPQGRTPLYLENAYPDGRQIEVKLFLPGYKVWTGTFTGGATAKVDARLKR